MVFPRGIESIAGQLQGESGVSMAVSAPRSIITIVLLEQIESGLDFSEAT